MIDNCYLAEKFSIARSILMLPHSRGEEESIAEAFHTCRSLLHTLDRDELDEDARGLVRKLDDLMNTDGLSDPSGRGLWLVKAKKFSTDEKLELSSTVDALADWFARRERPGR